jgi:cyclic pyranopterin phosphate synthase
MNMGSFSHLDSKGKARMVDVGGKVVTKRTAKAQAVVVLGHAIMQELIKQEFHTKKGSIEQSATIAGTFAVKKTSDLIPLCHPLPIDSCSFNYQRTDTELVITCTVSCSAKTGVEMEALTGASTAALTVYDMCKSMGYQMEIQSVKLLSKEGGKSDYKT